MLMWRRVVGTWRGILGMDRFVRLAWRRIPGSGRRTCHGLRPQSATDRLVVYTQRHESHLWRSH
jgi:hypothetical protein